MNISNDFYFGSDEIKMFIRGVFMTGLNFHPIWFWHQTLYTNVLSVELQVTDHVLYSYRYFDYLFYVDFETSMADQNAQNALRHLRVWIFLNSLPYEEINLKIIYETGVFHSQEFATYLRVLGSYPMDASMLWLIYNW